ncbi:hypothetical protein HZB60_09575 [candidate division KSB1 bacterium]|nr:hypothetical protein [candidate division KSB1 bacterium]
MKRFDISNPVWKLETIGWIVFAILAVFLVIVLAQVPHSTLWIILGATVAITARLFVGRRM